MSDQKHLTLEGRIIIEKGLDSRLSFKAIACAVNKDCTTISKEVRGHLSFEKTGSYGRAFNDCLHRKGCPRTRVCTVLPAPEGVPTDQGLHCLHKRSETSRTLLFLRKVHNPVPRLRKGGLQPPPKASLCLQRMRGPE